MTIKQWNAFLAVLLQNTDPDSLDAAVLQTSIIGDPKRAGAEFTRFLQNGCRLLTGSLKVIPRPFDPAIFPGLGEGWRLVPEEHDTRNDQLTEVDFETVDFTTGLEEGETSITGEEKLRRLKAGNYIRLGASVFHVLWLDYQARKENSVLENLYRLRKLSYLDLFGDVILAPDGDRHVLDLCRYDGRWGWSVSWLDDDWDASDVSAVSQACQLAGE